MGPFRSSAVSGGTPMDFGDERSEITAAAEADASLRQRERPEAKLKPQEHEGRLELTWTNKGKRLLADEDGSYDWYLRPTTESPKPDSWMTQARWERRPRSRRGPPTISSFGGMPSMP